MSGYGLESPSPGGTRSQGKGLKVNTGLQRLAPRSGFPLGPSSRPPPLLGGAIMNTRHEHDTHSHTPSPLRAPSRGVLILTPEEAPLSSEFFLLFHQRFLCSPQG